MLSSSSSSCRCQCLRLPIGCLCSGQGVSRVGEAADIQRARRGACFFVSVSHEANPFARPLIFNHSTSLSISRGKACDCPGAAWLWWSGVVRKTWPRPSVCPTSSPSSFHASSSPSCAVTTSTHAFWSQFLPQQPRTQSTTSQQSQRGGLGARTTLLSPLCSLAGISIITCKCAARRGTERRDQGGRARARTGRLRRFLTCVGLPECWGCTPVSGRDCGAAFAGFPAGRARPLQFRAARAPSWCGSVEAWAWGWCCPTVKRVYFMCSTYACPMHREAQVMALLFLGAAWQGRPAPIVCLPYPSHTSCGACVSLPTKHQNSHFSISSLSFLLLFTGAHTGTVGTGRPTRKNTSTGTDPRPCTTRMWSGSGMPTFGGCIWGLSPSLSRCFG